MNKFPEPSIQPPVLTLPSASSDIPNKYQNLSQIAKASGKALRSWVSQPVGKNAIAQFKLDHPEIEQPIITIRGRGKAQGTYAHPSLAAIFAAWCNPQFTAAVVDENIKIRQQNAVLAGQIEDYHSRRLSPVKDPVGQIKHEASWDDGNLFFGKTYGCKIAKDKYCNLEALSKKQWEECHVITDLYWELGQLADHIRWWERNGKPFAITTEPYESRVTEEALSDLQKKCDNLDLLLNVGENSEWKSGCKWIEIRRS